ncbi:MAG: DUF1285 domain-containing protein [Roseovarius sp.]|nr:DUF1285 domain-containing protein [Roseovarius sp.]
MSKDPITAMSVDQLASAASDVSRKGLPPVHEWHPDFSGDIDIRITRDGAWYHEGDLIRRPGLVRLFSTILRKEGDDYYLVTPVEKVRITVDDAPFVAVDFEPDGTGRDLTLTFETNVGDRATAGPRHPVRVARDPDTGEPSPYVLIRDNLEALIDRKSFYRLVELGTRDNGWFGVWSGGEFFRFARADELPDGTTGA